MIVAGCVWILFALALLVFLLIYLMDGAGAQVFGFLVVPGSVVIGWIHVMGLLTAAGVAFSIGAGLCAYGVASPTET